MSIQSNKHLVGRARHSEIVSKVRRDELHESPIIGSSPEKSGTRVTLPSEREVLRRPHSVRAVFSPPQPRRARSDAPYLRAKPWLVPVALLLVLASLFITRTVLAKIAFNTIDTVGIVTDKGRHVTVTGPIAVTEGERTELRVTVTQRSTGALAEGVLFFAGTGQTNQWEITAKAEGRATFQAGPATVVGLARSSVKGKATDAHQWLVNVTLLSE